jgi:hypothetical protein
VKQRCLAVDAQCEVAGVFADADERFVLQPIVNSTGFEDPDLVFERLARDPPVD